MAKHVLAWLQRMAVATSYSILLMALMLFVLASQNRHLLSVQSNSMTPTFAKGDVLILRPVPSAGPQVGDIISYRNFTEPSVTISHRIIESPKAKLFITAGDATHTKDLPVTDKQVIGIVVAVAPGLGKLLNLLHTTKGVVLIFYLPAAVLIYFELRRLLFPSNGFVYKIAT